MKRIAVCVVVAMLAVGGCSSGKPASAPSPSAAGSTPASSPASATPSASPSSLIEFTVDGAGPYQLGAMLTALQSAASLDEVTAGAPACPGNTVARGTGIWTDLHLSFHQDGTLYLVINRSPSIPTPSGAWLGTTLAQLKTIYAAVTGELLTHGTATAYLVTTVSGRGILFDLDANKRVVSMAASDAAYLRSSYVGGTKFC